ncbi:MAG: hypothetical protein R2716_08810 [Microthrixaceae bacterium]
MALLLFLALLIGLTLGAVGGGGSILALPVLVGVAGLAVTDATTASLIVVGATSPIDTAWPPCGAASSKCARELRSALRGSAA